MSESEKKAHARKAIEEVFNRFWVTGKARNYNGWDIELMKNLKLVDVGEDNTCVFEIHIDDKFSNINDVLHGGAAATIYDMCTSMATAPLAKPGQWEFLGGVSRTINISFLKPVLKGTTIHIVCQCIQQGRTMAMITSKMISPDGKTVYGTSEQHKVHLPPHMRPGERWVDGKLIVDTSKL